MGRRPLPGQFLTIRPGVVKGCRVLELGAGAGLPGLVAARCGAAEVLLTDGDARRPAAREKCCREPVGVPRRGGGPGVRRGSSAAVGPQACHRDPRG